MKNKEFLFIYDAAMCNPNGDPDQENKPRMDRKTRTNIVSDGRLKRYIRDYLEDKGSDIFVSLDEGKKISVEKKLHKIIKLTCNNKEEFNALVLKHSNLKSAFEAFGGTVKEKNNYQEFYQSKLPEETDKGANKKWKELGSINNELLIAIVKENLIDIRFFGGAFAVAGFSNTFIGSIQLNWGYSLHPVELIDSNSIVTIMSGNTEGESNMGKKEGLYYSLIAFTGTINAKRAMELNMVEDDVNKFRESIIQSLYHTRTDSKKNQYPRLYLEIEYNDDACYGRLGDIRNLIEVTSNKKEQEKNDFEGVRSLNDLGLSFKNLKDGIENIRETIHKIRIWKSLDSTFSKFPTDFNGIAVEILNI